MHDRHLSLKKPLESEGESKIVMSCCSSEVAIFDCCVLGVMAQPTVHGHLERPEMSVSETFFCKWPWRVISEETSEN